MEEHAEKLVAAVPQDEELRYSIETLEIERSRLIEAIRAMRAMATTEDDYPGTRVKEQRDLLQGVEHVLEFLRQALGQWWLNFEYKNRSRRGSNEEAHTRPESGEEKV
jgi:hypothetical protein